MLSLLLITVSLASPPSEADLKACANAQVANTFDAWASYLESYPEGICARAPAAADVAECSAARASTDSATWVAYAALHPKGFCMTEATAALHDAALIDENAPRVPDLTAIKQAPPVPRSRVGGADTHTGSTTTTGALAPTAIEAAFSPFEGSLKGCGSGTAKLFLAVTGDGVVVDLEVEGVDESTSACLLLALDGRLTFPAAEGPTRAVHRLQLDEVTAE